MISAIQLNFDLIDARIREIDSNAEDFFKGATASWGSIAQRIPAQRDVQDEIMQPLVVDDALDKPRPLLFLLVAQAGNGKSTLLRMIAAELALTWDREVLFLRRHGRLDFLSVESLGELTGRRIYLCVDNATDRPKELADFLDDCSRSHLKISVIATARTNEWEDAAAGSVATQAPT